jgi:hypothetical protein
MLYCCDCLLQEAEMKKITVLAMFLVMTMIGPIAWAQVTQVQEEEQEAKGCFFGLRPECTLRFKPDLALGLGAVTDTHKNGTLSAGAWFTSIHFKNRQIRLGGFGIMFNCIDDIAFRDSTDGGGLFAGIVTFVPIQIGPFSYQFSIDGDMHVLGINRGRMHMVTFDFVCWGTECGKD